MGPGHQTSQWWNTSRDTFVKKQWQKLLKDYTDIYAFRGISRFLWFHLLLCVSQCLPEELSWQKWLEAKECGHPWRFGKSTPLMFSNTFWTCFPKWQTPYVFVGFIPPPLDRVRLDLLTVILVALDQLWILLLVGFGSVLICGDPPP